LNELALFAGAGGGILGGHLLGWRTVAAVEIEDYPRRVLLQRQADGLLPRFPIWDDIRTFDGKPWAGKVDVVSGGFPCQDISAAGKGDGLDGERSGMWAEMARIICEVRPGFVFVENSPMLTSRGLGRVLGDLASMGFDARWGVLGADFAGFDHKRNRIWIVANSTSDRLERGHNSFSPRQWKTKIGSVAGLCKAKTRHDIPAPDSFGVANGVASRMDRLKAVGNGQVSPLAATAWRILK
jgi:DNA (cytosine-5)-methyltransferase 1